MLKFDDVVSVLLSEETQRKSLGDLLMSGSALNMDGRERSLEWRSGGARSKSRGKCRV